jgi:hypothetical protein
VSDSSMLAILIGIVVFAVMAYVVLISGLANVG